MVSPWYAGLRGGQRPYWVGDVRVPFSGGFEPAGVGVLERDGVKFAFVGHPDFSRGSPYGYPDDARRFARFSRAVPQAAARLGFTPEVVHANDWQTAYLPLLLARGWHLPPGFAYLPTIFTVHNAQFQGEADLAATLHWLRLGEDVADSYLHHFGNANAMQAALGFATRVTTVSPTYALELQRPEYGFGLDGTFRTVAAKTVGILNGIDTAEWDPAKDPHLSHNYSVETLSARAANKAALSASYGLSVEPPLLAVVSRFAHQKGIDLLLGAAENLQGLGFNLLLLGSGDQQLEDGAGHLAATKPGRVAAQLGFDEGAAHRIYAGADALLVPSRFEPCGLTQMIAMRYGALPVVRETGGLKDTVTHGVTGFVFRDASAHALTGALEELRGLHGTPAWREMQLAGMRVDNSWEASARRYAELYLSVLPS